MVMILVCEGAEVSSAVASELARLSILCYREAVTYNREPEFCFSVSADTEEVERNDHDDEDGDPSLRRIRRSASHFLDLAQKLNSQQG